VNREDQVTLVFLVGIILPCMVVFASEPKMLAEHSPGMLTRVVAVVDGLTHSSPTSTSAYAMAQVVQAAPNFFLATFWVGILTVWIGFAFQMRKLLDSIIEELGCPEAPVAVSVDSPT